MSSREINMKSRVVSLRKNGGKHEGLSTHKGLGDSCTQNCHLGR